MKKILTLMVAAMLVSGASYACGDDKKCEGKSCCKKDSKKEKKAETKKDKKKDTKTVKA